MNKRIDELIKECTSVYDDLVYDGRDTYMKTSEYFDKTKFAKLVVKDVCNIVLHFTDVDEGVAVAKKHFGVEE